MNKIKCSIIMIIVFIFSFILFSNKASALDDGVYEIHSSINEDYVIDINKTISNEAGIVLNKKDDGFSYKFLVNSIGDGYYSIKSADNTKYSLDVPGSKKQPQVNIQLYEYNGTQAQQWIIKDAGDGYYNIISRCNNLALDVKFNVAESGTQIWQYDYNNSSAQKFRFVKSSGYEKTIDSGLYTISSAIDNNMVIDLPGTRAVNENGIQLYQSNGTSAQKWYINYLGDGYYSIRPYVNIKYSLDVPGSKKQSQVNIQLYEYNGTQAQQWIIKDAGNGYYNIISRCNNLALDVKFNVAENETPIWQYDYNNSSAQKFKFIKTEENITKTIDNGYYFINTSLSSKKALDVGGARMEPNNNVQLYDLNYTIAQKWYIEYLSNGYYKILCNKDSSFALSIVGTNVVIEKYNDLDSQKWSIIKASDKYYIKSKDDKYLSLERNSIDNENKLIVSDFNGDEIQKFDFKKTADGISEKTISDGIYTIASALNNQMVLDLSGGSLVNGTNVQLYKFNGTQAQRWRIEYQSNGYYKITSMADLSKSLDMAGGVIKSGANIQSYEYNGTQAQQWIIREAGNGYYNIISNCGGYYLNVDGGQANNEANINIYEGNNTNSQKFRISKSENYNKVLDVSYHQGSIDWDKVADTGIYGVILRIGYWDTEDERFEEYISEVKRLGIPYGIYLFSYASTTNGANIEANFTNSIISKYNLNPTLGIYYDLEDWYISADNTSNNLSKSDYDNIARTYINSVSSYVGSKYKVKIYASLNFINNRFGDYARSQTDWVAHYGGSSSGYDGPHSLWQYTSEATLDGVRGYVDMSYLY